MGNRFNSITSVESINQSIGNCRIPSFRVEIVAWLRLLLTAETPGFHQQFYSAHYLVSWTNEGE